MRLPYLSASHMELLLQAALTRLGCLQGILGSNHTLWRGRGHLLRRCSSVACRHSRRSGCHSFSFGGDCTALRLLETLGCRVQAGSHVTSGHTLLLKGGTAGFRGLPVCSPFQQSVRVLLLYIGQL